MADATRECASASPTDWPDNLPQLRMLDNLFRCPICFEYINTAMILPQCSHNYCSLCIRKYITYKTQCPTCTQNVAAPELKNNRLLDDVIRNFVEIRSKLLALVKASSTDDHHPTVTDPVDTALCIAPSIQKTPSLHESTVNDEFRIDFALKESAKDVTDPAEAETDVEDGYSDEDLFQPSPVCSLNTSFTARSTQMPKSAAATSSVCDRNWGMCQSEVTASTSQGISTASLGNKVACPVCNVMIPERNINLHLDRCLNNVKNDKLDVINVEETVKRKPLPKFVYNLMADKELKKRLVSCNLPTTGDRQTMIKRHQAYTVLYNSQCDALHPKLVSDIVKEVLENEKNTSKLLFSPTQRLNVNKGDRDEDIATAQKQYAKHHKSQFSQLIADTKKRHELAKRSATATSPDDIGSDDNTRIISIALADKEPSDLHTRYDKEGEPTDSVECEQLTISASYEDDRVNMPYELTASSTQFDCNDAASESSVCSSLLLSGGGGGQACDAATRTTDDDVYDQVSRDTDVQSSSTVYGRDDSLGDFPSSSRDSSLRNMNDDDRASSEVLDDAVDHSNDATTMEEDNKESKPLLQDRLLDEHTADSAIPALDDVTENNTSPDIKRKRSTRRSTVQPSSKRSKVVDAPRRTLRARK